MKKYSKSIIFPQKIWLRLVDGTLYQVELSPIGFSHSKEILAASNLLGLDGTHFVELCDLDDEEQA